MRRAKTRVNFGRSSRCVMQKFRSLKTTHGATGPTDSAWPLRAAAFEAGMSSAPNPTFPLNVGSTVFSGVASVKSSLHFSLVYFRQPEFEVIEENLLVVGWLGEATFANVDAATSWHNDVEHS